ncbi:MAG: chemotaxis protein CheW [Gammaproteobacteria bacterium]|nr:chemotaxis protein CheW [Gammaproteobacteria bacterium]
MSNLAHEAVAVEDYLQWVTFRLDSEVYGVNVMQVQEVLRMTDIAPVPGAPDYVLGIINLRGNVVTVLDARKRFKLNAKEPDDASRILITEINGQVVGLLVDSVAEVINLRSSDIEASPAVGKDAGEHSRYIQGVLSREHDILILIDLNKLLTDNELEEVAGN